MSDPVVTTVEPVVVAPALPSDGGPAGGLLAGKFANAEELEKGYSNLATLLGKQGKVDDAQLAALIAKLPAPAAPVPVAAPGTPEPAAATVAKSALVIDPAKAAVESAGLKVEDMAAEYAKEGKLSDASMAKLATVGVSKEVVNSYIAGQEALRDQVEQKAFASVGGEDKYKQMATWALTGMKPEELVAFNAAVIGTPAASALAISGLKARFEAAVGSDPALISGNASGAAPGGYTSQAEVTSDINDPRYKKDPAYRDQVKKKLSRSGPLS